jgi:hypothetical protein
MPSSPSDACDQGFDLALGARVQAGRGFVQEQQVRAAVPRPGPAPGAAAGRRRARVPAGRPGPARPTRCSAWRGAAARSPRGTPRSHSASCRLRRADRFSRKGRWNSMAAAGTPLGRQACRQRRAPWCGTRPCSSRSSVVLPEPLAPTSARRSPRCSVRSRPRPAPAPRRSQTPASCRLISAWRDGAQTPTSRSPALRPPCSRPIAG